MSSGWRDEAALRISWFLTRSWSAGCAGSWSYLCSVYLEGNRFLGKVSQLFLESLTSVFCKFRFSSVSQTEGVLLLHHHHRRHNRRHHRHSGFCWTARFITEWLTDPHEAVSHVFGSFRVVFSFVLQWKLLNQWRHFILQVFTDWSDCQVSVNVQDISQWGWCNLLHSQ